MSRFNNLKALSRSARSPGAVVERAPAPGVLPPAKNAGQPSPAKGKTPASLVLPPDPADVTLGQTIGFALLCVYIISGYANEFAIRALGAKAYISTVALPVLPVVLLLSGNLLRGLRDTTGRLWLGFVLWMSLAVPFSVWRGGSVGLLQTYLSHSWVFYFLIVGFAVSLRHCRRFLSVMIAADLLMLVDCAIAARLNQGRLDIPDSLFFANANDLSLQLALGVTHFMYLLFQPRLWQRLLAGAGITAAVVYSLQTGSRAGALAMLALGAVVFVAGKHRIMLAIILGAATTAAVVVVPQETFHRISLLAGADPVDSADLADLSAAGSRAQRLELLRQSLDFTITHPLLGVGPGQFAVAVSGEAQKVGKRAPWLGTHNSFTEVSSECGIPAFLLYTGVVILCLVSNLRMYLRSKKDPQLQQVNALAFCTFCGSVVFTVSTFFYHIAYSSYLPTLAGMTVVLRLSTDRSLWGARREPVAVKGQLGLPGAVSKGVA